MSAVIKSYLNDTHRVHEFSELGKVVPPTRVHHLLSTRNRKKNISPLVFEYLIKLLDSLYFDSNSKYLLISF